MKSESSTSIYKKIKVTDDISDKPTLLDRTTDSRCSNCLNEMENDDNESQDNRACVHENDLQQIANKSQDADVPVIQKTSKHKHIPVDINELDTENSASEIKLERNINPENKISQIISTCPVECSAVKIDSFIPKSNVLEANITTADLVSVSSATNLPEFDASIASGAANFKESEVDYSQSFEHDQALTKNVHSDNCRDVVKLNNNDERIHTKIAESTVCTDVNKATVNTSVEINNSQSNVPDVYEIGHSDNCDMKVNDESNTNDVEEKLSHFDNISGITEFTLNNDVVKCPKVFKDLHENQMDINNTAHEVKEVMPEVDIYPPKLREDCGLVNSSTESAVSEYHFHLSDEVCKTKKSNVNMSEICVVETDNHSAEIVGDKTNISDSATGTGEHDTLSAEPMEVTDLR